MGYSLRIRSDHHFHCGINFLTFIKGHTKVVSDPTQATTFYFTRDKLSGEIDRTVMEIGSTEMRIEVKATLKRDHKEKQQPSFVVLTQMIEGTPSMIFRELSEDGQTSLNDTIVPIPLECLEVVHSPEDKMKDFDQAVLTSVGHHDEYWAAEENGLLKLFLAPIEEKRRLSQELVLLRERFSRQGIEDGEAEAFAALIITSVENLKLLKKASAENLKLALSVSESKRRIACTQYAHSFLFGPNCSILSTEQVLAKLKSMEEDQTVDETSPGLQPLPPGHDSAIYELLDTEETHIRKKLCYQFIQERVLLKSSIQESQQRAHLRETEHTEYSCLLDGYFDFVQQELEREEHDEFQELLRLRDREREERLSVELAETTNRLLQLDSFHNDLQFHIALYQFHCSSLDLLAKATIHYSDAQHPAVSERSFSEMNDQAVKDHRKHLLRKTVNLEDENFSLKDENFSLKEKIRLLEEMLAEQTVTETSSVGFEKLSELGELDCCEST